MKIAIIDLGSNSARMNIVEFTDNVPQILQTYRKIVRLSEGMGEEKQLQQNAVERTLITMREFKKIIDENNVDKVRAIATAALRSATNKELFLKPVKDIGFDFEIISGEKEAYYDYMAVVNTLDVKDGLVIDIGGASTEIILVKDSEKCGAVSVPMASVNITEKYFSSIEAKDSELERATEDFLSYLKDVKWLKNAKNLDVIGLGGTIRALAYLQCKADNLHGYSMSREFVIENAYQIAKMPLKQRLLLEGLEKGRADIIHGGIVPLVAIMKHLDSPNLITCLSGLREGIMYDIVKK